MTFYVVANLSFTHGNTLMSIFNETKCFSVSFMINTFEHVHPRSFLCYPDFLFHYDVKLVAKKK